MFGRQKKPQPAVYALMGRHGTVHAAGNPGLHEGWTLQGLADNFAVNPGDRCLVWAGEPFSPMRIMGETADSLEQQFGPPDAIAER